MPQLPPPAPRPSQLTHAIYDGEGDKLMQEPDDLAIQRIVLVPDAMPARAADIDVVAQAKIRILWGQHLLEDLLAGSYRSLVCAVNTKDNSHGLITQLANLLPTSQWNEKSITERAKMLGQGSSSAAKVVKYDMDSVEVLAILKHEHQEHLTLDDLARGFKIISEMMKRKTQRIPSAAVSFLGARSNRLLDDQGQEPSFESVLRTMHEAGYHGDIYPATSMWDAAPTGVYARYPFPPALNNMRSGGF